jgi:hypothetical protein
MKPPFPGNRRRYNRKPAQLQFLRLGFAEPVQGLIAASKCADINGRHSKQAAFMMICSKYPFGGGSNVAKILQGPQGRQGKGFDR